MSVCCRCVDTAPCQRRFEASSVTVRAEANRVVGRLCLSALLDPVIQQAQSTAQGTDHHLLQQVKNIEVTGKDLQPHTHALTQKKNCWPFSEQAKPSGVVQRCVCVSECVHCGLLVECSLPGLVEGQMFLGQNICVNIPL